MFGRCPQPRCGRRSHWRGRDPFRAHLKHRDKFHVFRGIAFADFGYPFGDRAAVLLLDRWKIRGRPYDGFAGHHRLQQVRRVVYGLRRRVRNGATTHLDGVRSPHADGAVRLLTAARRRPARPHRWIFVRIGAKAPNGVVVAKGDDDLPPHNALRSCHITPEVNGFALFPPRRASGPPLR